MSADKVFVRMIGVARPSLDDYAAAMDGYHAALGEGKGGMPLPPRRQEPVYADVEGKPMIVRPGAAAPVASPFPGEVPPAAKDPTGPGMHELKADTPKDGPLTDLKAAVRGWAAGLPAEVAQSMLKSTLTNLFLTGGPGNLLGTLSGALDGSLGGVLGGLKQAAGAMSGLFSSLSGAAGGSANVAGILPGGCFPGGTSGNSGPVQTATGFSPSGTLAELGGQLLSQWKVQDSDSMGEQMAHHFANKWKEQLKDPSAALKKLKGYFTGATAPAAFAAVRLGDTDAAGDPVLAGSPTVTAEGKPLSRIGDPVKPPGVAVYMGAATVLTNGQMTARVTSASQAGPFTAGAATVFVNGVGGGAPPPPKKPPEVPKEEAAKPEVKKPAAPAGAKPAAAPADGKKDAKPGEASPPEKAGPAEGGEHGEHGKGEHGEGGLPSPVPAALDAAGKELEKTGEKRNEQAKEEVKEKLTEDAEAKQAQSEELATRSDEKGRLADEKLREGKASAMSGGNTPEEIAETQKLFEQADGHQALADDLSKDASLLSKEAKSIEEGIPGAMSKVGNNKLWSYGGTALGAGAMGLDAKETIDHMSEDAEKGCRTDVVVDAGKGSGSLLGGFGGGLAGELVCTAGLFEGVVPGLLCFGALGYGGSVVGGKLGELGGEKVSDANGIQNAPGADCKYPEKK